MSIWNGINSHTNAAFQTSSYIICIRHRFQRPMVHLLSSSSLALMLLSAVFLLSFQLNFSLECFIQSQGNAHNTIPPLLRPTQIWHRKRLDKGTSVMIPFKKAHSKCDGMGEWMQENKYHLMKLYAKSWQQQLKRIGQVKVKHNHNNRMSEKNHFEI